MRRDEVAGLRSTALDHAVKLALAGHIAAKDVIEVAKKYEAFLIR